ncbi:phosphoglycerate mutase [Thraustotheca clavata]|uniref:Phosphoglycerate mutase n=1 Tax=Thraustotheca clavata TaxID=74557 RepID=A0A1V9ZNH4_9STRA|nr:phosphoglycerate mutase [Thraustotheca clavata]
MASAPLLTRRGSRIVVEADGMWSCENMSFKRLVLVTVGLPARGKSFVMRKLTKYTAWLGFPTKIFNAGNYRRMEGMASQDASFFDAENADAKRIRDELAMEALMELIAWIEEGGHVAVFDATNTTKERRELVWQTLKGVPNIQIMFIENICDSIPMLEANYLRKLKNEDYANADPETALADFKERVAKYEKVYETIEDSENDGRICYVKVFNAGEKVQARFCQSFLPSQCVSFLQNIHLFERKLWLVRPGPNRNGEQHILGGDEELTEDGHKVARSLADFMMTEIAQTKRPIDVWHSTMKRAKQTSSYIPREHVKRVVKTTLLNELGGGDFEGFTREELAKYYPRHFEARRKDKLRYRYPGAGGESYIDVICRLRPLIIEFERKKRDCLIICSESIMRCLMGYFMGVTAEDLPHISTKVGIVYELSPHRDGCDIKELPLDLSQELREDLDEYMRANE